VIALLAPAAPQAHQVVGGAGGEGCVAERVRLRDPSELAPALLTRIDTLWSVGIGLAIVDTIRAADFQTRHMVLAHEAGDATRMACALAAEASFSAALGGAARARTERLVSAAETLAKQVAQPNPLGYAAFAAGTADYLMGLWRSGREKCDHAETILRDWCTGVVWFSDTAQYFALECLWYGGVVRELCRRVPMLLENAVARGDLYAATILRVGLPNARWLIADRVDEARRSAADAMAGWSHDGFHQQHLDQLLSESQADLYLGDARVAHERVTAAWPRICRAFIPRVQLARIVTYQLRGRAALGAAAAAPAASSQRRQLVDGARRDARRIARDHMPWGDPLAALLHAGASWLDGEDARAAAELRAAVQGFDAAGMALYAAAARRRLGELLGGDEGAALIAIATAWMRAEGIVRPERMAAMLAPGFFALSN
jgi:hypothetical protein